MKLLILFAIVTNFQICWCWVDPDCFDKYLKGDQSCLPPQFKKTKLDVINATKTKCGVKQAFAQNIVGGEDTIPGEWPWMAKLVYTKDFYCSGSLVSFRHVVTAAHCIDEESPTAVRLGESDITTEYDCLDPEGGCQSAGKESCFVAEECADKYQDIGIEKMLMHPRFSSISDNNAVPQFDVALLVLSETVKFSDYISPVCLPEPESQDQTLTNLVITGWGNTSPGFRPYREAEILQKLNVKLVPLYICDQKWKQKIDQYLLPYHICVNTFEPGKSSCRGDSGGPLVRLFDVAYDRWEISGIISFGVGGACGNVDLPIGLTRIAGLVNEWLRNLIGEDLPVRE